MLVAIKNKTHLSKEWARPTLSSEASDCPRLRGARGELSAESGEGVSCCWCCCNSKARTDCLRGGDARGTSLGDAFLGVEFRRWSRPPPPSAFKELVAVRAASNSFSFWSSRRFRMSISLSFSSARDRRDTKSADREAAALEEVEEA